MVQNIDAIDWRGLHGRHFEGSRILVTGGAGFIGSHLGAALSALGAAVVVLDDLSGGSRTNLAAIPGVEFIEGSILDRDVVAQAVHGCNYVYHEAALGSVPRSVELPRLFNEVNVTGTLNVLEASREAKVQRVIFAASSSAYGDNPVPWTETMPVMPRSPYAATKVADEALLRAYAMSYGLDTACLRYFNIFGPRQNANSAYAAVIAAFAKSLINGEQPVIFGDGQQSRDFTFVANAVHANLLAARSDNPIVGQVINVGCGTPITVAHLATVMAEAMGCPELTPILKPVRAGDMKHSYADLTRAKSVLGYEPIVSFTAGLRQTIAWYAQTLGRTAAKAHEIAAPLHRFGNKTVPAMAEG